MNSSFLFIVLSIIVVSGISYLLGSIPFAVIVSSIMGLPDPRRFGSKNPGQPTYYEVVIKKLPRSP